ncbi:MAG: BON domain-containing protein [Gemmatimonadaceae bacterium]
MSPFRYRDEDDASLGGVVTGIAVGALAGFAVGVALAQRVGGLSGIASRLRERLRGFQDDMLDYEDDEYEGDEDESDEEELEERVLEAFRNDPVMSERAVDIGALGDGIIELSGWVHTEDEADHAVTLARGVPAVETVVNRLLVGEEEDLLEDNSRRLAEGDDSLTVARWEGQRVGTGPRRQGTSDEPDRHADPKPPLREHSLDARNALRDAAEDVDQVSERRRGSKRSTRGDRTGGGPVAPGGVPKTDHVANHEQETEQEQRAD